MVCWPQMPVFLMPAINCIARSSRFGLGRGGRVLVRTVSTSVTMSACGASYNFHRFRAPTRAPR
eukprot:4179752-Prymnesium_polylepis.1